MTEENRDETIISGENEGSAEAPGEVKSPDEQQDLVLQDSEESGLKKQSGESGESGELGEPEKSIPPKIPPSVTGKGMAPPPVPPTPGEKSEEEEEHRSSAPMEDALELSSSDRLQWIMERLGEEDRQTTDKIHRSFLEYELGELLEFRKGDKGGAGKAYGKVIKLNPGLFPNLWAVRRILAQRGRWDNVIKLLDAEFKLTKNQERRADILLEKARVYESALKNDDAAVDAYGEAHKLAPGKLDPILALERILASQGNMDSLAEIVKKHALVTDAPLRRAVILQNLARIMGDSGVGDYEERRGLLFEALKESEDSESVLWDLSRLAVQEVDYELLFEIMGYMAEGAEGAGLGGKALALRRQQAILAQCRLGSAEKAWAVLEPHREAFVDNHILRSDLTILAWIGKRWEELVGFLESAAEEDIPQEEKAVLQYERYLALLKAGNRDAAAEVLESLKVDYPEFLTSYLAREQAALENGDALELAQVVSGYRKVVESDEWPKNQEETKEYRAALLSLEAHLLMEVVEGLDGEETEKQDESKSKQEAQEEREESEKREVTKDEEADGVKGDETGETNNRLEVDRDELIDRIARLCNESLSLSPRCSSALFLLEEIWARLQEWEMLSAWLKDRVVEAEGETKLRILEALAHIYRVRLHNNDGEIWALEKLVGVEPENKFNRMRLMDAFARGAKWLQAISCLEHMAEMVIDPQRQAGLFVFGAFMSWFREKNHVEALRLIRRAKEVVPEHELASLIMEDILIETRDWSSLVEFYEEEAARALDEDKIEWFLLQKGETLELRLGKDKEALEVYEDVADRFPDSPSASLLVSRVMRERTRAGTGGDADESASGDLELAALIERDAENAEDEVTRADLLMLAASFYEAGSSEEGLDRSEECMDRAFKIVPFSRYITEKMVLHFLAKENWTRLCEVLDAHLAALEEHAGDDFDRGESWPREVVELLVWALELAAADFGGAWRRWGSLLTKGRKAGKESKGDSELSQGGEGSIEEGDGEVDRESEEVLAEDQAGWSEEEIAEDQAKRSEEEIAEDRAKRSEDGGVASGDVVDVGTKCLVSWAGLRQAVRDKNMAAHGKSSLQLAQMASGGLRETLFLRSLVCSVVEEGVSCETNEWVPESDTGKLALFILGAKQGRAECDFLEEYSAVINEESWFFASAVCLRREGALVKAAEMIKRVFEKNPKNYAAALFAQKLAKDLGDKKAEAQSFYTVGVLCAAPDESADAFLKSGELFLEVGEDPGARKALEGVLALRPEDEVAYELLGKLLESSGDWEGMHKLLTHRLSVRKDEDEEAELYVKRARLQLDELGSKKKAAEDFHRALRVKPDDAGAMVELARLYAVDGDDENAIELLRRVCDDPREADEFREAKVLLAEIMETRRGDPESAGELLQEGLGESSNPEYMERLLAFYVRQRKWDEAVDVFDMLKDAAENDAEKALILRRQARMFRELMLNHGRADKALLEARSLAPDDMVIVQRLAKSYKRTQNERALDKLLKEAIEERLSRLADEPAAIEIYRSIYTIRELGDESDGEFFALSAMGLLKGLSEKESKKFESLKKEFETELSRAVDETFLRDHLCDESVFEKGPWGLWRAMKDPILKLYEEETEAFGVKRSNRLDSEVLQGAGRDVARFLGLLGVNVSNYYKWPGRKREIRVFDSPDGILVVMGEGLLEDGESMNPKDYYSLGKDGVAARLGVLPIIYRGEEDVVRLFEAAAYEGCSVFSPTLPVDELAPLGKRIKKALSWRERKALNEPAERFSRAGVSIQEWFEKVKQSCITAGLVLSGDLMSALMDVGGESVEKWADLDRAERASWLEARSVAGELLRFVVSDEILKTRRGLGLSKKE